MRSTLPSATDTAPGLHSGPFARLLPLLLLVSGLIGTVAAFVLTIEQMALLTDAARRRWCATTRSPSPSPT